MKVKQILIVGFLTFICLFGNAQTNEKATLLVQEADTHFEKNEECAAIPKLKQAFDIYEKEDNNEKYLETATKILKGYWVCGMKDKATLDKYGSRVIAKLNHRKTKGLENLYYQVGRFYENISLKEQMVYFEEAIRLGIIHNNSTTIGLAYLGLAKNETQLGKIETPFLMWENAKNYLPQNSINQMLLYEAMGEILTYTQINNEKGLMYLEEALAIAEAVNSVYHQIKLIALIGDAYHNLSQSELSETHFRKAITLHEKTYKENTPLLGTIQTKFGILLMNFTGELEEEGLRKSKAFYLKVLAKSKEMPFSFQANLAMVNLNYGRYYYVLKDYEKSGEYLLTALTQSQKIGWRDYEARALADLSGTFRDKRSLDSALVFIQQSLMATVEGYDNPDPLSSPNEATYPLSQFAIVRLVLKGNAFHLQAVFRAEERLENMKRALDYYQFAIRLMDKVQPNPEVYEATNWAYVQALSLYTELAMSMSWQLHQRTGEESYLETWFKNFERGKGSLLTAKLKKKVHTKNYGVSEWLEQENDFKSKISILEQRLGRAIKNNQQDSIRACKKGLFESKLAFDTFFEDMKVKNWAYYNNRFGDNVTDLKSFQASLDDATVALSYFVSQTQSTGASISTFFISKTEAKLFNADFDGGLRTKINSLYELLQSPLLSQNSKRKAFIEQSHFFYKKLFQPLKADLAKYKKILLFPEDDLLYLPFELLLESSDDKPYHEMDFLIKKKEISYHYSASLYSLLSSKTPIKDYSWLGFAPVFDKRKGSTTLNFNAERSKNTFRSIKSNRFIALPGTEKEIQGIAKTLKSLTQKETILLRKEATEAQLKTALKDQQFQFVHLASHSLVDLKSPQFSALATFQSKEENDIDDGLFYVTEIENRSINADLVILSSCESGIGQLVIGEGFLGLNRSFFNAGANNVLFSLWKVNDLYSSELMIEFYKAYVKEGSYSAALRTAKLKLIENKTTAMPVHWSAFILIGK